MSEFRRRLLSTAQGGGLPAGTTFDFPYTGTVQEVTLPKGTYKLQCWGAQGGNTSKIGTFAAQQGPKGGYSEGIINITSEQKLFVFVGGQPEEAVQSTSSINGGWNGGGGSCQYDANEYPAVKVLGAGGGATDIALVSSNMTYSDYRTNRSQESLLSRFIVAGGGGGMSAFYNWDYSSGSAQSGNYGEGGGVNGLSTALGGGSQSSSRGIEAGFGFGATRTETYVGYSPAGGGGWYGAGLFYGSQIPGSGGSGFVNVAANAQYRPSGYTGLELESGQTIAGNKSFPSVDGGSETGHSGNGYARITAIGSSNGALPSGYRQLEYIQSWGDQYIDTGWFASNNTEIVVDYQLPGSQNSLIMGNSDMGIGVYGYTISAYYVSNNIELSNDEEIIQNRHTTSLKYEHASFDGENHYFSSTTGLLNTNGLLLFVYSDNGQLSNYAIVKLYSAKIYESGIIARDFVPCVNPDGEYGLYDMVEGKFYSNKGTGGFTGA